MAEKRKIPIVFALKMKISFLSITLDSGENFSIFKSYFIVFFLKGIIRINNPYLDNCVSTLSLNNVFFASSAPETEAKKLL